MLKNKKAFSYIELLFGMVIVVIIFTASVPFITRKSQTQATVPGEYVCFNACVDGQWRLYQTISRNNEAFSAPEEVSTCQFYKQKNVNSYNVTLYGGGGSSSMTKSGMAAKGKNGDIISFSATLAGVWDENNRLVIRQCRKAGLFDQRGSLYDEEYSHCVGRGGFVRANEAVGSVGKNEINYQKLLGVYHDLAYNAKTNIDTVVYAGFGDGYLADDDKKDIEKLNDTTDRAEILTLINNMSNLHRASELLKDMLANERYDTSGNTGAKGEYTRFVLYDVHPLACNDGFGNCIARGGEGGTSLSKISGGVDNSSSTMQTDIADAIGKKEAFTKYLGAAGKHRSKNDKSSPVGNGGAIFIKW